MRKILLAAALLSISACGFHLKGTQPYDKLPYATWRVEGGALQQALETALIRADGRPADTADTVIAVSGMQTRRDVLTITRAANINEYLLVLNVSAQASHQGQSLGGPISVEVRRRMDYADTEVLGKQEEEALIWQEMRRDAAEQIVRRMAFLKAARP